MDDDTAQDSSPVGMAVSSLTGGATAYESRADPGVFEPSALDVQASSDPPDATAPAAERALPEFDPEAEDRYWAETYNAHSYAYDLDYKAFQPACRYGWESFLRHPGRQFDEVEEELRAGWEQYRGNSGTDWGRARAAARAAWNRLERASRKTTGQNPA
jgi:hypothetical protein